MSKSGMWLTLLSMAVSLVVNIEGGYAQFHGEGSTHGQNQAAYPKLNYDSLYEVATPLEDGSEGLAVLQRCLESYGTIEHWRKLEGLRLSWTSTSHVHEGAATIVRSVANNRRHRVEIRRPDRTEVRVLNGPKAWIAVDEKVAPIDRMRYNAELFTQLTMRLPLTFTEETFSGRRWGRRGNDSLDYIYLDKADSILLVVGIDTQEHLVKVVEGVIKHDENRMIFVNLFADHKPVDGYLLPHKLTNISLGLKVGESVLEKVEINPEFAADEFAAPKPSAGVH